MGNFHPTKTHPYQDHWGDQPLRSPSRLQLLGGGILGRVCTQLCPQLTVCKRSVDTFTSCVVSAHTSRQRGHLHDQPCAACDQTAARLLTTAPATVAGKGGAKGSSAPRACTPDANTLNTGALTAPPTRENAATVSAATGLTASSCADIKCKMTN